MNETLTVRLGAELARALQQEAKQTGLSKGELARQSLEARLGRPGKLAVMQRYFGVTCGPADLSTNKEHRRRGAGKRA